MSTCSPCYQVSSPTSRMNDPAGHAVDFCEQQRIREHSPPSRHSAEKRNDLLRTGHARSPSSHPPKARSEPDGSPFQPWTFACRGSLRRNPPPLTPPISDRGLSRGKKKSAALVNLSARPWTLASHARFHRKQPLHSTGRGLLRAGRGCEDRRPNLSASVWLQDAAPSPRRILELAHISLVDRCVKNVDCCERTRTGNQ